MNEEKEKEVESISVLINILKELEQRQKDFEDPGSYMEEEWYIICKAKAEAFEEAISMVKKHLNFQT